MAIIQSLQEIGEQPTFYNIDYFRYRSDQVEAWFKEHQFDVVGISAVVSTAYAYTQWLSLLIRRVSPRTVIVVGGNLAASGEILLRKCQVDFCVSGDGELVIKEFVSALRRYRNDNIKSVFETVKGICFLDSDGRFRFTGFGQRPEAEDIGFPDYSLLARDGSLPHFIYETLQPRGRTYADDPSLPQQRPGKTALVISAKGCVARCTFCHRWEQGYRARPTDKIIAFIGDLIRCHGVTHIDFGDENFGADRKLTHELVSRIGELGVTWQAAGVRVRTVRPDDLLHWRRNGCVNAYFGIESGSRKILEIMEKNATVEENINALKWVSDAKISTIVQLIVGMPGETDDTIKETIEFLKRVSDFSRDWSDKYPSELISINYAQALPGTPLYEWAREHGYIGQTIEEEEAYLLRISDTDAYKEDHFINYTGLPLLKVLMWRPMILAEIDAYHAVQKGWCTQMTIAAVLRYYLSFLWVKIRARLNPSLGNERFMEGARVGAASQSAGVKDSGYFNIHANLKFAPLLLNRFTRQVSYALIAVAVAFWRGGSIGKAIRLLVEHIVWSAKWHPALVDLPTRSLRKSIALKDAPLKNTDGDPMILLRLGR
jgi:radical SAM superfamily enzyme YgiQ (UPF0313 family)